MILSDVDLKQYIDSGKLGISTMTDETIRENGLDLRFGREFAVMKELDEQSFDTRGPTDTSRYFDFYSDISEFIVPSHSSCLTHTLERIKLPPNLMGFCELRSSYARLGLSIPPTIIDAGFEGQLTIALIGGSFPVKVYPSDRFLHVVFSELTSPVARLYAGKYFRQSGIQLPVFTKRKREKRGSNFVAPH